MPSSELAFGSSSIPCGPSDLNYSHSVHTHFKTGPHDANISKKEHMSTKICQNLRRKLSVISKLRAKLHGAASGGPEYKTTESTAVSDLAEVSHRPDATLPTPELDASYCFPRIADLPSQQSRSHATQAELAAKSVHELPCLRRSVNTEGSENKCLQRMEATEAFAPPLPYPQTSMVSTLSSQWDSPGSVPHSSWQFSQCSGISGITPGTSLSETDWSHDGLAYSATYDNAASPSQPLRLDTYLTIPQTSIIDGPLTDSPTNGDLADFPLQQQIAELDAAAHPWSVSQGLDAIGAGMLPSYSGQMQQPPEPEELVLSSPGFLDSLQGPDNDLDLIDESLPEYATWEPTIDGIDSIPAQFLDACRLYASSVSHKCHSNVKTVLEAAFEVTKLYYLKCADIPGRMPTKALKRAWSGPPTIEAALRGMNCLLTNDAAPSMCELISLAFLTLALLGLSLDTTDLAVVVSILHHQAKLWSSLIPIQQDRTWFEDFIDDLWLLAEQDQRHTRRPVTASAHHLHADSTSLSLMDSNVFAIQVAQIFIHFVDNADMPTSPKAFPSLQTVLEEDYRKMLGTLPSYTYSAASSPLLDLFEAAGGLSLPDTYEELESFIRNDHSHDHPGLGTPRSLLAKRLLKVLGGRYVGRLALWLYQQLMSSAQRVVSCPQGLAAPGPQLLPPIEARTSTTAEPSETYTSPPQARLHTKNQQAGSLGRPNIKAPPEPRQAVKRKSSSDSDRDRTFRCDEHDQVFTGEYAENSYKRHMRRTKEHGPPEFKCHICQKEAFRVDHYQNHMKQEHGLKRRRKGGGYYFERINDEGNIAELEGSPGAVAHELSYMPASVRGRV